MMLLWGLQVFAQQKIVTGKVTNQQNDPMARVTVRVKGTTRTSLTDENGVYKIEAANGETLQFSSVGVVAYEQRVGETSTMDVTLTADEKALGEVVVTAYNIRRNKRELSYQAPVVKGDDISATRRDNFLNSLAGRVPGLTVTSTSGSPGASSQIILRGAVSIAGSNQPLFVVDGVPANNSTFNQESFLANASNLSSTPGAVGFANRTADYTNRIADLNPEDIESVTILKGPEASALYGSDGASGAIVITTRKGGSGKSRVSYDNAFRVEKVYRFPDIQKTYSRGINGIYDPTAYNATYGFLMFGPKYPASTQTYDNLHNFFQSGFSQQHNLSLEAGTSNISYRFSAGYLDNTGVVPNTEYQRINLRLSGSAKLSPKMNMSSSWAYIISDNKKASKGPGAYYSNLITWPIDDDITSFLRPDGSRKVVRNTATYSTELDNPLWDVNKNKARDKTDRVTGTVQLGYDPTNWLNFTAILGVDHYITDGLFLTHPQSRYGFPLNGFISIYTQNFRDVNGTIRGTVRKNFGDKYTNELTVGFFAEDSKQAVNAEKGERFFEPNFISINNTDPTSQGAKLTIGNTRKARFFGNYTFGFDRLLYINLSGSYEGVSTLTSAFFNKQPTFAYGAVSGSFILSDMNFMKSVPVISFAKLRASYATTGKAPLVPYVIDYRFVPQVTTGGGYLLDVTGGNANLKPEFSKNVELGGEFQFLKGRLGVDLAWYKINSRNQIISNRLSYGTGYVLQYINGGLVTNNGIEIQLTGAPVRSSHVDWNVTVNFDHNRGIVKKMPADLPFYYDSDTWLFGNLRSQVGAGLSIANLAGNRLLRNNAGQLIISPTTGLPVKDLNFVPVGDRNPDYKIGFINQITFNKNWSLSINLDIRKGGDVFNGNEMMMVLTGVSKKTLDREQPRIIQGVLQDGLENTANPTTNNIVVNPYYRNDFYSSMYTEADFIETVNWLRLRDVTLQYNVSGRYLKHQKLIKTAGVYVTGTDLFLITNYTGVDPNVNGLNSSSTGFGGAGIDYGSIPNTRGINFGIKVQF
jgi:TonB-linked SusC/RagA family outer membrane protein